MHSPECSYDGHKVFLIKNDERSSIYLITPANTTLMSLMLQEIAEQPSALEKTIAEERSKIQRLGESLRARGVDLIVLVARGSSDNAAVLGR